jgi:hypothetical protein
MATTENEECVKWDVFMEQTKRDVEEELRKLQSTHKSVTSKEHHKKLESHFKGQTSGVQRCRNLRMRSGTARFSLAEHLYRDIEELVSHGRVSSILTSPVRRQALEISLAENLYRHNNRHGQNVRRSHPQSQGVRNRSSAPTAPVVPTSPLALTVPTAQGVPQAQHHYPVPTRDQSQIVSSLRESPTLRLLDRDQREAIVGEVSSLVQRGLVRNALTGDFRGHLEIHIQERADRVRSGVTSEDLVRSLERRRRRPGSRGHGSPHTGQRRYRVPQRDQSQILSVLRNSPTLNSLPASDRDAILSDVGGLVQRRLVSSALSGDFRGVMEVHIQQRADQMRTGVTADNVVQSLERRRQRVAHQPRQPETSSLSRSDYHNLRQEISELRSQLTSMHQMLRSSFDLQLDIQRSIRQEVSSAMHAAFGYQLGLQTAAGNSQSTTSSGSIFTAAQNVPPVQNEPPRRRQPVHVVEASPVVSPGHCVICLQAEVDCVLYRCGHMCVDMQCALELKAQALKCPICRAPIVDVVKAYSAS